MRLRAIAKTLAVLLVLTAQVVTHAIEPMAREEIRLNDVEALAPLLQEPADDDGRPPAAEDRRQPFVEPRWPQPGVWYLGVFGHYTSTGHLLTEVLPGTPASHAGLEPGDRIITVNGYQVGDVLNRQYPIDVLLQRHASPGGLVRLLVQDRRTSRLVNLDMRLVRRHIRF